jgi:hypothetical protein
MLESTVDGKPLQFAKQYRFQAFYGKTATSAALAPLWYF